MITQEYLKSILNYNAETGVFTWKVKFCRSVVKNSIAGRLDAKGYFVIGINKKTYKCHRLAWLYVYGYIPTKQIDHINGNRSDNRISNLREANNQQNSMNSKKSASNTSGVKNVYWHKPSKKWIVSIRINNKQNHIGCFDNFDDAAKVSKEIREKYFKNFARHY